MLYHYRRVECGKLSNVHSLKFMPLLFPPCTCMAQDLSARHYNLEGGGGREVWYGTLYFTILKFETMLKGKPEGVSLKLKMRQS